MQREVTKKIKLPPFCTHYLLCCRLSIFKFTWRRQYLSKMLVYFLFCHHLSCIGSTVSKLSSFPLCQPNQQSFDFSSNKRSLNIVGWERTEKYDSVSNVWCICDLAIKWRCTKLEWSCKAKITYNLIIIAFLCPQQSQRKITLTWQAAQKA